VVEHQREEEEGEEAAGPPARERKRERRVEVRKIRKFGGFLQIALIRFLFICC
jgi:hypothetical protein